MEQDLFIKNMKALELLKEIVKSYPDVVAIAQDCGGLIYAYNDSVPVVGWIIYLDK